ncbi:MAG TPA: divalent-cation tolerance protein CutA [Anaeromyxobacteraceae bacterium]|nr:divalent-cation tolerance protein CutA [Anaeromyxobacteraceae bacterium]
MTETVVILVTAPTADVAASIARTLVEERLVACGNVVPAIRSIYRWEGAVHDDAEALLVLKTERRTLPELKVRLKALHPYQVPEFLALPVEDGLAGYLEWVGASLRP